MTINIKNKLRNKLFTRSNMTSYFFLFLFIFATFPPFYAHATITFNKASMPPTSGEGQNSIQPIFPSGISNGDLLLLSIGMKPSVANSGSVTTPVGWTLLASHTAGGYGATLGGDTGNTYIYTYYRIASGNESDRILTVTLTNDNIAWASIKNLTGTLGGWDIATATGSQDSAPTSSLDITFDSDPGVTAGDMTFVIFNVATDVGNGSSFSNHNFVQTGVTFDTVTEINEIAVNGGNDSLFVIAQASVASGTSSGAPHFTATVGNTLTNVRGPALFIRVREVATPGSPTFYNEDGGSNQIAFNGIKLNDNTPIVRLSATSSGSFDRFLVEFNTQSNFKGTAYTETFSGTYSSDTAYNLQTTGSLGLPTTDGVTYYLRARASSDSGSHYGDWSTPALSSFTYTSTGDPTWFQTTDDQLKSFTSITDIRTSGSGSVQIAEKPYVYGWTVAGNNSGLSSDLILDKPSGVYEGDLLLIFVANDNAQTVAQWDNSSYKPTGFTFINEAGSSTNDSHIGAFYRIADGTEADTITVPAASSSDYLGYYVRVSGADISTPIDAIGSDSCTGTASQSSCVVSALTTTVANTLAFTVASYDGGRGSPFSVSGTGWNKVFDVDGPAGFNIENSGVGGIWATKEQSSIGSTETSTISSAIADGWSGFQFAVRPSNATSGTIMSPEVDYDWGAGASSWGEVSFSTTESSGDVKLKVYHTVSTACDTIVPDGDLPGNSSGFDVSSSPIDISGLTPTGSTYNKICLNATLSGGSPTLDDWGVSWVPGINISGTADGNDAATVKVAVNGTVQSQTGFISSGTWLISGVPQPSAGDIITVWIDGVDDTLESTAVTKYSSGYVSDMVLNTNVLTMGSDQNTSLSVTDFGLCDVDTGCLDEDIMHTSNSGSLLVQASGNTYTGETLKIISGNTLTVSSASSESITTKKLDNAGTITATGTPTINLAGTSGTLFTNTGTFTQASSTVDMTGNGDATLTSNSVTFYNLTSSGTGTKSLGSGITIATNGTLSVTDGTFNPATYLVTGSGTNTLSVGASGTLNVDASTFAGNYNSGFTTRTLNTGSTVDYSLLGTQTIDNTLVYSNLNTSEGGTKTLGGDISVSGGLTIGSGSALVGSSYTITLSGTGDVFDNQGTYTAGTSTIKLTDTSSSLKTFIGGGGTYNNFWYAPGTGTGSLEIQGSNTFNDFKDDGTGAHSILFTAGTTQTVTTFTVSGNSGALITVNSGDGAGGTSTSTHTLSQSSGTVNSDYLDIQHSVATGGATWNAGANSVDNNSVATAGSGWIFSVVGCTSNTTTGNWNDNATWDCGYVPTIGVDVTIRDGDTITMDIDSNVLAGITINGVLNTSGTNYSLSGLTLLISSTGTLVANGSTITLSGTGDVFDNQGTYTAGTSTIKLTDTSSSLKTFIGGGGTYNNFWYAPGTGTGSLEIQGSNTFNDFKDDGTGAHSILFTAGTTQTVATLTLDTNSANYISLESSTPDVYWNLESPSGTITVSYVSIQDSCASGGATWNAYNGTNIDVNHNCGWRFQVSRGGGGGGSVESSATPDPGVTGGGINGGSGGAGGEGSGNVGTCADGIQNGDETGVDTGGRCSGGGQQGGGGGDLGYWYYRPIMA